MKKFLFVVALVSLTFSPALLLADSPTEAEVAALADQWFAQFEIAGVYTFSHSLPNCDQWNGTACYTEGAHQQCVYGNNCDLGQCSCYNSAWFCVY